MAFEQGLFPGFLDPYIKSGRFSSESCVCHDRTLSPSPFDLWTIYPLFQRVSLPLPEIL